MVLTGPDVPGKWQPNAAAPIFARADAGRTRGIGSEESLGFQTIPFLVTGTQVDVRNLKERFRSSQISLRATSQPLRPFVGPKCPSESKHLWPNWRCEDSHASTESNNSLH